MAACWVVAAGPATSFFFPSRRFEAAGLEESYANHRHQGVSMIPVHDLPRSGRAQVLLELLVRLFTDPSGLMAAASILIGVSAGRFDT